eukprot:scaffold59015_cov31-Tisochrysis_lutea.AAC.6
MRGESHLASKERAPSLASTEHISRSSAGPPDDAARDDLSHEQRTRAPFVSFCAVARCALQGGTNEYFSQLCSWTFNNNAVSDGVV